MIIDGNCNVNWLVVVPRKSVVIYVSIVIYVVAKNALVVYGMRRRLGNERAILFGM